MKNKYEIRGDVTAIFLDRRNGERLEMLIDTEDLERVRQLKYKICPQVHSKRNNLIYARMNVWENGKIVGDIRLHRFITNCPEDMVVDHINHNTLDNRKCNLRVVTQGQNNQNTIGPRSDNKRSGVKNVYLVGGKWAVKVNSNGKSVWGGKFDNIEEAKVAAEKIRAKLQPFSPDAMTISVSDDEKILPDPDRAHVTNKHSGIKNIHWNKSNGSWSVCVAKKFYGSYKDLDEAKNVLEKVRAREFEYTKGENAYRTSKTGIRGVFWSKKSKKWVVAFQVNKKRKEYGYFNNFDDAVKRAEEIRNTLK